MDLFWTPIVELNHLRAKCLNHIHTEEMIKSSSWPDTFSCDFASIGLPRLFFNPSQSSEPPWQVIAVPGGVGGGGARFLHFRIRAESGAFYEKKRQI